MRELTQVVGGYDPLEEREAANLLYSKGLTGKISPGLLTQIANVGHNHNVGQLTHRDPKEFVTSLFNQVQDPEQARVQEFLRELDFKNFTGDLPSEKALSVAQLLKKVGGQNAFKSDQGAKQAISKMKEMQELLKSSNEDFKKGGNKGGDPLGILKEGDETNEEVLANLADDFMGALKKLKMLQALGQFRVRKAKRFEEDPLGMDDLPVLVSDLEDLMNIPEGLFLGHEVLGPHTMQLFIEQQLEMYRNFRRDKAKQLWIMAVDRSGSMDQDYKHQLILAMLLHLGGQVIKNEAVLFLGGYEGEIVEEFVCPRTKEEFRQIIHTYKRGWLGGTNIENVVRNIQEDLKNNKIGKFTIPEEFKSLGRPEMAVLCDGQDRVSSEFTPELPVNIISIEQTNKRMEAMAQRSGGTYVEFFERNLKKEREEEGAIMPFEEDDEDDG